MNQADLLIRDVTILEPASPLHQQKVDLLLKGDDLIINPEEVENIRTMDGAGKYISSGWTDLRVFCGEPGFEHKENMATCLAAATAGGFARIGILPDLDPVTDHKSHIQHILSQAAANGGEVVVLGALSAGLSGADMSELYDMFSAGAGAFTDGDRPVQKTGLLLRALRYCQPFGARIWLRAEDSGLASGGKMHEGLVSVTLGLKGIPAVSEYMAIARDLEILRYTGGKLHFSKISTKESVALIRKAKAAGLDVTSDVTIHHLISTDEALKDFNPLYKLVPPLRSEDHRLALCEGVNDGTVDAIVSDHRPENIENKALEFDFASPGMIGTQLVYSLYQTFLSSEVSPEAFVRALTSGPAACARFHYAPVQSGKRIPLTLFDPAASWKFDAQSNGSLSSNSPYLGKTLSGKATLVR